MAKKKKRQLSKLEISARQVWLAGLGALAEAEKRGDKAFQSLVKKGKKYEALVPSAGKVARDGVEAARKHAEQAWHDMESAFEHRLERALERVGVASRSEVEGLRKKVAEHDKALSRAAKAERKARRTTAKK